MRKRTQARELALQAAYQIDLRGEEAIAELDEILQSQPHDKEVLRFARELVAGWWEHRKEIDAKIEAVAKNWEIKRMAAIDRNILRIAAYELLHRDDIPALVSINEAIDIAKKYSTPKSGKFVNGILDNIRLTAAPEAKRRGGAPPAPAAPSAPSAPGEEE